MNEAAGSLFAVVLARYCPGTNSAPAVASTPPRFQGQRYANRATEHPCPLRGSLHSVTPTGAKHSGGTSVLMPLHGDVFRRSEATCLWQVKKGMNGDTSASLAKPCNIFR
jgi:hypothetical protein